MLYKAVFTDVAQAQPSINNQMSLHILSLQQQVASLERSRCRRTTILKNLPAPLNRRDIDNNLRGLCKAAGYDDSVIEDAVNHVDHNAAVTYDFVTFTSERACTEAKSVIKKGFRWRNTDGSEFRVKTEDDVSPQDGFMFQPFYALIETVKLHHAQQIAANTHYFKANKQQLQVFFCQVGDYPDPKLIGQLIFMPDQHSFRDCLFVLRDYIPYFDQYP